MNGQAYLVHTKKWMILIQAFYSTLSICATDGGGNSFIEV